MSYIGLLGLCIKHILVVIDENLSTNLIIVT